MATATQDFWTKSRQSDTAVEEFSKLYYNTIDKKRHALYKLYMDNAKMVWNGHVINGIKNIKTFVENLPISEYKVDSIDSQPLYDVSGSSKLTILVTVCGASKFEKCKARMFNHSFLITAENNVWKIVSESFVYHE